MSVILPAPPTIITVTRSSFKDKDEPHLAVFNGTNPEANNNRPMTITWDRFRTILTEESLAVMSKQIKQHQRVEVRGRWTIYVNAKTQKATIGMILEHIKHEDPSKAEAVQDVDIPTEKRFNYVETEDLLNLQKYTHIHEINKIDRKTEERAKIRKVETAVDYSDSEPEDPTDRGSGGPPSRPGGGPSSGSGGPSGGGSSGGGSSGGGSSGGGSPSSKSGGPPSSTKPGATKPGPGKTTFTGTHQRFGGDDVIMS
ncbi:hypothetical protein BGZ81_001058 [Podila clonocystis]|nr:hypothetical protein BGZ81_001058 [Podila clonocystis]